MTAFTLAVTTGSLKMNNIPYNPTLTANSIAFDYGYPNAYGEVISTETFTGTVQISYDVTVNVTDNVLRIRPTKCHMGMDCGIFGYGTPPNQEIRIFDNDEYKEVVGPSFSVVETYNTVTGACSWTVGGYTYNDTFTAGTPVRLKFSCGDGNLSYHSSTTISNIVITATSSDGVTPRAYGVIV